MAIVEAISIPIGVTGQDTVDKAANSYEDLGDAVAKTKLEAEKLANTFGINDKRTQDAIKVAGKYKQEMEQLDSAIDGARSGVATLTQATQGVVAGMQVAAGVAGLFGSESEELQKMLLKVQSAMALSQGLKDFKQFGPAIKGVATLVQGNLVKAFKTFSTAARGALAATGIGLFIVALGSIVAYWDDIIKAVSGTDAEQLKLLKSQQKSAATAQEQLDSISEQENILKQQGKTEGEILQMKIAATKTTITALEAQLITQQQVKQAQVDASKRNQDILKGMILFISLPLTALLATVDKVGKALGQDFGLLEGFTGGIAEMVFDPKEVEKKGDETIKETQTQLDKLKNNLAGHENTVTANRTKAAADKKAADKKAADDEFNAFIAQEVANEEYREQQRQKEKQRIDEEFEMEMAQIVENDRRRQEIADEEFNNFYAQEVANEERRTQLKEKAAEDDKKRAEDAIKLQEDVFKSAQELLQLSNSFIENSNAKLTEQHNTRIEELKAQGFNEQQIADMRDDELIRIDERAKQNFEIAKRIRYAETLLATIQGTQQAFTTANASPITAVFPAYPFIQAAAAAAFGIAQLQQISQSKYESKNKPSASGGGGAPTIPQFNAPTTRLQQNDEFTQVRRIFVTERDISNVQDKVRVTEGLSQF